METVPIWKLCFMMMAMNMYLGTPMLFIVPGGVAVGMVGHENPGSS